MIVPLLGFVSVSHLKSEKIKTVLTVLGMALGIAVYAGIRFASGNVFESFESSTQILSGPQSRLIVAVGGRVEESDLQHIAEMRGIASWLAVSQRFVDVEDEGRSLGKALVIGLDMLKVGLFDLIPPGGAEVSRKNVLELLKPGNAVAVARTSGGSALPSALDVIADTRRVALRPVMRLPDQGIANSYGGRIIVMDMAVYQELFRDYGRVDHVLILGEPDFNEEAFNTELREVFEGRLQLISGEDRTREGRTMTEAFKLNLQFLACVSLAVALLLIYNSVSYAVLKRRREFGILMALGVAPKHLFKLITVETIVMGLLAACIGVLLGYALSFINVRLMSASVSNLYFPVSVRFVQFQPAVLIECLVIGPLLAWGGSLLPCLEIFRVPARETFHYQNLEAKFKKWVAPLAGAGLFCFVSGVVFSSPRWLSLTIYMGFVPPSLFILAAVLLLPTVLTGLIKAGKRIFQKAGDLPSLLALDHIESTLHRNVVAVASAMIAIGMYMGMSTMIISFRGTVNHWIEHVTKADVFVSTPYAVSGQEGGYLPAEVLESLSRHPDVRNYDWITSRSLRYQGRVIKANGTRFEVLVDQIRLMLKNPLSQAEMAVVLTKRNAVFISETFSNRFGFQTGDRLTLTGSQQEMTFEVIGVFFDYSSDQGVVLMRDTDFARLFNETRRQGMALYLKEPEGAEKIKEWIGRAFPEERLLVRQNRTLRREVMAVFDETFQITRALQWIALLIAAFAIFNTILMMTLEREREFGVLRALGAGGAVLSNMMVHEAVLLGTAALAGGVWVGLLLSLVLVFVVNKFFFAWSVQFAYPLPVLATTVLGSITLSALAGWIPSRFFVQRIDARMLRYE